MPLGRILADAHVLLDEIAKDATGRDAIACRVWKPGGQALEWSMPWEVAAESNDEVEVVRLSESFQRRDADDIPLANGFFYRIRERLEMLNPMPDGTEARPILDEEQARALMAMEYINSGLAKEGITQDEAIEFIAPLLQQCRPRFRKTDDSGEVQIKDSQQYRIDGALLVRFLAQKGMESR